MSDIRGYFASKPSYQKRKEKKKFQIKSSKVKVHCIHLACILVFIQKSSQKVGVLKKSLVY